MNIQLFFENKEVELTEDIRFPLNKTYENLSNPTDIVVDYSKSIKIPITKKNNELFGNIFRLDKQILSSTGERNIGMYFDPARKIPFKLVYNQDVLIEGYAKFISASYSVDNKYYTVTLFSTLGDIFQKLNSIVVSRSQLTEEQKAEPDGGNKYILDDGIDNQLINADYVYHSFTSIDNDIRNTADIFGYNIIGFAPSYRGLYGNFNSNKIQTSSSTFQSLEDNITGYWNWYFQNQGDTEEVAKQKAEALKAGELIGDGLKDYQMREYRSYEMKPYIYFNQLMHMYERKCKEITGYDLVLDKYWFNANNPYWTKSCYMLDFLENKGSSKNNDIEVADKDSTYISYKDLPSSAEGECVIKKDNVVISPINGFVNFKAFKIRAHAENTYDKSYESGTIELDKETYVDIYFTIKDNAGGIVREKHFWYNEKGDSQEGYNPLEYVKVSKKVGGEGNTVSEDTSFLIPNFTLAVDAPLKGASIEIRVKFTNNRTYHNSNGIYYLLSVSEDPNGDVSASQMLVNPGTHEYEPYSNTSFRLYTDEIISTSDWKSNLYVKLANLYFRDEPLFNVILEYTKMFGLLWDIDYANKQVKIQTRYSYFKDIDLSKVPNWDDKVDRSKDYLIEPISFQDAYLKFNYNNIDGYRYKQYKDKYANNYGEKKLYTGYEFNGNTKDLFKDIDPSCVESKTFLTYLDIINWDINNSKLTPYIDDKVLASAESNDEKSSISIYNWYLRNDNVTLPYDYYITDDTDLQKTENSPCWISPAYLPELGLNTHSNSFPVFSPVYKANYYFYDDKGTNFGGLFNMPLEDYTFNGSIAKASGNYIYDLFWENYLNERYNYQNKKLTAYFRITPDEFLNFKFNKFIMLDNQLFMINKIIDYDITSPETCKCELIQVFDYKTYINGSKKFAPIATDVNSINIAPDRSYTIEVMSTPEIEYTLVPESTYVFPEDFESNDWIGYSAITITNELYGNEVYDGNLIIKTIDGQNTKVIPVHAVGEKVDPIIADPNQLIFEEDGTKSIVFTSTPAVQGATVEYTGSVGQIRSLGVTEISSNQAQVNVQAIGFDQPGPFNATLIATNRETICRVPIIVNTPGPEIVPNKNKLVFDLPGNISRAGVGEEIIKFKSSPVVNSAVIKSDGLNDKIKVSPIRKTSGFEVALSVQIDGFVGSSKYYRATLQVSNGINTYDIPIEINLNYLPILCDINNYYDMFSGEGIISPSIYCKSNPNVTSARSSNSSIIDVMDVTEHYDKVQVSTETFTNTDYQEKSATITINSGRDRVSIPVTKKGARRPTSIAAGGSSNIEMDTTVGIMRFESDYEFDIPSIEYKGPSEGDVIISDYKINEYKPGTSMYRYEIVINLQASGFPPAYSYKDVAEVTVHTTDGSSLSRSIDIYFYNEPAYKPYSSSVDLIPGKNAYKCRVNVGGREYEAIRITAGKPGYYDKGYAYIDLPQGTHHNILSFYAVGADDPGSRLISVGIGYGGVDDDCIYTKGTYPVTKSSDFHSKDQFLMDPPYMLGNLDETYYRILPKDSHVDDHTKYVIYPIYDEQYVSPKDIKGDLLIFGVNVY